VLAFFQCWRSFSAGVLSVLAPVLVNA